MSFFKSMTNRVRETDTSWKRIQCRKGDGGGSKEGALRQRGRMWRNGGDAEKERREEIQREDTQEVRGERDRYRLKEISANAWGKQVSACMPTETLSEKHTNIKDTWRETEGRQRSSGGRVH